MPRIGEYQLTVVSNIDEDRFEADVSHENGGGLTTVYIEDGLPVIFFGPNRRHEKGIWKLDYRTFRRIVQKLDDFLMSIDCDPSVYIVD